MGEVLQLEDEKKKVDVEQLRTLSKKQWTMLEIASFFRVKLSCIRENFFDIIKQGREEGKGELRSAQWESALSGNSRMQIHLGRHYLGQHDQSFLNITQSEDIEASRGDQDKIVQEMLRQTRQMLQEINPCQITPESSSKFYQ